jgi:hypothetical protein
MKIKHRHNITILNLVIFLMILGLFQLVKMYGVPFFITLFNV